MSSKDNGEPAFPCPSVSQDQSTGATTAWQCDGGMTLRDYFAAKAMQGFCAHIKGAQLRPGETGPQANARLAYQYADAMLEARKQ